MLFYFVWQCFGIFVFVAARISVNMSDTEGYVLISNAFDFEYTCKYDILYCSALYFQIYGWKCICRSLLHFRSPHRCI